MEDTLQLLFRVGIGKSTFVFYSKIHIDGVLYNIETVIKIVWKELFDWYTRSLGPITVELLFQVYISSYWIRRSSYWIRVNIFKGTDYRKRQHK